MSKVTNMVIFISITLLIFHFGGLLEDTPISQVIVLLKNPQDIQNSGWFGFISAALAFTTIGAVFIGFFGSQAIALAIKAPIITGCLITIMWDLLAVAKLLAQINVALSVIVISPLMMVYLIAIVEWWR